MSLLCQPSFLSYNDMILSFFPFDQSLQTNRDIKLMGVGLFSCCNPGVTSDAKISGAVAGDEVENLPWD
jgi:hypothetical protein